MFPMIRPVNIAGVVR